MSFPLKIIKLFIAAATLLLVVAGQPEAQSHICQEYGPIGEEDTWILFEAGNPFISGSSSVDYYIYRGDLGCFTVGGSISPPGGGWAYASSAGAALSLCERNLSNVAGVSVDPKSRFGSFYICKLESGGTDDSREKPRAIQVAIGKSADGEIELATVTGRENLPLTGLLLKAADGMNSGIQFRRLDAWGIGIQEVLDMGFLDAVDVWSNIGSGFEVCFPQSGRLVFLDAASSPRSIKQVRQYSRDGYTCASMDRAGTMVLVEPMPDQDAPAASTPTEEDVNTAIQLEGCSITPVVNLRLRGAPWGKILDVVPQGTRVAAQARTESWVKVKYSQQQGWSAAWLTKTEGECAWRQAGAGQSAWNITPLIGHPQ